MALSFGRRPVRRPLPHLREVLLSKHLRSAAGRLAATSISDSQRRAIGDLLRSATERAEAGLRDRFRPLIVGALDNVDLQPHNLAEHMARKKLVEELLDRIVDRGFLTLGDLRDALSRNNLKQPDFYRLRDLFHGDALLRTDQRLAVALDGVYQRGEFYLRWMQQISSLAFGTRTGRFFTRYAAVPFGGAYLALAFMEHLIKLLFGRDFEFEKPVPVLLLGTLFLTLLYIDWFRNGLGRIIVTSATTLRNAGLGSARWLMQLPLVQFVICSQLVTFAMRFLVKPLALTAIIWAVTPLEKANWRTSAGGGVTLFFGLNMFLNSRLGRTVEEVLSDWIVEGWHRIGVRFLAGLFWWIVDLFRGILQAIERALYAVEQWLRLKSGQSKTIFVVKAALGVAWFFVAYVIRFCINLLIEPQINPIKHFPVVTVAHKLLLPLIPHLAGVLEATMEKGVAYTVATTVIAGIPGICGFLVWELRENWRLYAANRPRNLQPSLIGPHFETMIRLLKPGIHSGTLPKRYAKLRRAERHARANGNWKGLRKHLQALDRVELSIRRYAEPRIDRVVVRMRPVGRSHSGRGARRPRPRRLGATLAQRAVYGRRDTARSEPHKVRRPVSERLRRCLVDHARTERRLAGGRQRRAELGHAVGPAATPFGAGRRCRAISHLGRGSGSPADRGSILPAAAGLRSRAARPDRMARRFAAGGNALRLARRQSCDAAGG